MREQPAAQCGPRSPATRQADVVIVGAGMSGLWAAHHLTNARPDLRVVVLEAQHVGCGASGRNGGWLSQLVPGNRTHYAAAPTGADGVARLQQAMLDGITGVVRVATEHGLRHRCPPWWQPRGRDEQGRPRPSRSAPCGRSPPRPRRRACPSRLSPTEVATRIDVRRCDRRAPLSRRHPDQPGEARRRPRVDAGSSAAWSSTSRRPWTPSSRAASSPDRASFVHPRS